VFDRVKRDRDSLFEDEQVYHRVKSVIVELLSASTQADSTEVD
jgi:hypothetical protein